VAMTPSERRLRASAAGHGKWAKEPDRTAATAPGRAAFLRRFEDQVDPDRTLDPAERARRAQSALRSHMMALALRSAVARRRRRQREAGDAA